MEWAPHRLLFPSFHCFEGRSPLGLWVAARQCPWWSRSHFWQVHWWKNKMPLINVFMCVYLLLFHAGRVCRVQRSVPYLTGNFIYNNFIKPCDQFIEEFQVIFPSFLSLCRVLTELVNKMRDMQMDKTELGCLRAIVLFNPGPWKFTEMSI